MRRLTIFVAAAALFFCATAVNVDAGSAGATSLLEMADRHGLETTLLYAAAGMAIGKLASGVRTRDVVLPTHVGAASAPASVAPQPQTVALERAPAHGFTVKEGAKCLWTCPLEFYNAHDGCDCRCSSVPGDPDCRDPDCVGLDGSVLCLA